MASNSIGNLRVALTADSSKMRSGLERGRREIRGFSKDVRGTFSSFGKGLALGVGAAAGLVAIQSLRRSMQAVKQEFAKQLADLDELGKFSDRLGIATEKLSALQLQAGLAGNSNEQLNISLRTMIRNVGDAANGFGVAIRALDILGLSAARLSRMDAGDQFAAIAEQISKLPTKAQQASASFALFGRNGVKLLTVLDKGAAGVAAAQQRAAQLGIVVSREQAARAEQANDAILELTLALRGTVRQLVAGVAPAITAVARELTEFSASSSDLKRNLVTMADVGVSALAGLLNIIDLNVRAIKALQIVVNTLGIAAAGTIQILNKLDPTGYTDGLAEQARVFRDELEHVNQKILKTFDKPLMGDRLKSFIEEVKQEARSLGEEFRRVGNAATHSGRLMSDATRTARDDMRRGASQGGQGIPARSSGFSRNQSDPVLERIRDEVQALLEQTATPMEQLEKEYYRLRFLLKNGLISRDTANRALQQARERLLSGQSGRSESGSLSRTGLTAGVIDNGDQREQTREIRKQSETLRRIEQNTRNNTARAA